MGWEDATVGLKWEVKGDTERGKWSGRYAFLDKIGDMIPS